MSRNESVSNSVEMAFVFGLVITVATLAIFMSLEIWGESQREISSAAVSMLESGEESTQDVTFKLADPVVISVSNIAPSNVQLNIGFGDSEECMESIVYLTLKYRGEGRLVAESVQAGSKHFTPPKTISSSLIESADSLCQLATTEQIPVRMIFHRS